MRRSIFAPRLGSAVAVPFVAALFLAGCAADLDVQPLDTQLVQALFDPSLGIVPTPTDLIKDPATGLLVVPVADEEQAPAQATFDRYLNSLDGYPLAATMTVCFSGKVDPQSFDAGFVVIELPTDGSPPVDISDEVAASGPRQSADCPVLSKSNCDPTADESGCDEGYSCLATSATVPTVGRCASAGYIVDLARDRPWDRGTTYVTLATSALKAEDGRSVIPSATFELVASEQPICVWDDEAHRCTHNYAAAVDSAAAHAVMTENPGLTGEPLQEALRAAELEGATAAEGLRRMIDPVLSASGVDRSEVVVAWSFTTVSMVEALFNPDPDPSQTALPGPGNDILRSQTTGKVDLPLGDATGADRQLLAGLNTLDGFSTTASYFTTFSGELDAATVGRGGEALLLDMALLTAPPIPARIGYATKAKAVTLTPVRPLREGHGYLAVLISKHKTREDTGSDGNSAGAWTAESGGGLADTQGRRVVSSPIFALIKSKAPLVDDSGKSTVNVMDDEQAAQLEPLRSSYSTLLGIIQSSAKVSRDDVVSMWTFKTQTFTKQLTQLRALPWSLLDSGTDVDPRFSGVHIPEPKPCAEAAAPCWPDGVPQDEIGGWVPNGRFQSWFALDPATGALRSDPTQGVATREPTATPLPPEQEHVPFFMMLPKGLPCAEGACPEGFGCASDRCRPLADGPGWPLVLFQHGITRSKADVFAIANTLAQAGYATLAFDTLYHGDRSVCLEASHCAEGATCDPTTRRCCKAVGDTQDCQVGYFVGQGGLPAVSGGPAFLDGDNPFAIRDNLRQHVIDGAALLRAVQLGAAKGLKAPDGTDPGVKLDAQRIHYLGVSLGGMLGVPLLATDPLNQGSLRRAVLNVSGAPLVKIFEDTQDSDFKALIDGMLAERGIERGSKEALELFHILQWVVDPADPANFARFVTTDQLEDEVQSAGAGAEVLVPSKDVLFQIATEDGVIPTAQQTALASWLEVDVSKTSYAAGHGFLLQPDATQPGLIAAAQAQAVTFLSTGGVCEPQPSQGTCE